MTLSSLTSQYGPQQILNEPIHILDRHKSCIDLIIANLSNLFIDFGVHLSLHANCYHQIISSKSWFENLLPIPVWSDMVKHELRVTSCQLRVTSYYLRVENLNARVEIQKCKFKSTSYEFKSTNCEFKPTSYELIFTSYELKSNSYEFKSSN